MTVARPSTPASHFHLLRRQAYARPRRPLVVFTPKAMLRLKGATSEVSDFTSGRFEPVIDDTRVTDKSAVKRVILTSGKIYYDIIAELDKLEEKSVAVVRMEQYYPTPISEINAALEQYPNADIVWTQDGSALEGVLGIQTGEQPNIIEERLKSLLTELERKAYRPEKKA